MPITSQKLHNDIERELNVLDKVITYAERMLFEFGDRNYGAVRRLAYGKSVIIDTESEGTLEFRLAYSSQVLTGVGDAGYATPYSPVARLCNSLQVGDEDSTPKWGWYRVREVRLFDRFDGPYFESNVRNFLTMKVAGDDGKAQVNNLRQSLDRLVSGVDTSAVDVQVEADLADQSNPAEVAASLVEEAPVADEPLAPTLVISSFSIIEDIDEPVGELDDDNHGIRHDLPVAEVHFGLSESFYVNRTKQQESVISRSPEGPMFVQGVAGSGKTSAALGRTKMLCDFNGSDLASESEFREWVGDNFDYWSSRFAGKFSQEGSVGFVRTGELIQYLKETCRRLDLPHLPVQEYPELRTRLRVHRKLDKARSGRARWSGFPQGRTSHLDTSMAWLHAADAALAQHWAKTLPGSLPTEEAMTTAFTPEAQPRARKVARLVLAQLRERIGALAKGLSDHSGRGFALDKLAVRSQTLIEGLRKDFLSRDVIWVTAGGLTWVSRNEQEVARQLVKMLTPLHQKNGARLIFLDGDRLLDPSLTLLNRSGEPLEWDAEVNAALEKGELLVKNADGRIIPATASGVDHLYLRLLPEATERIYIADGSALRPLNIGRGLGRERLDLVPVAVSAANQLPEDDAADEVDALEAAEVDLKRRSMDTHFAKMMRRALLVPLTYVADIYSDTLSESPQAFPDPNLAHEIAEQLKTRKLCDTDIDLLLCLAHLIGRGYTATPSSLTDLPYSQAVFIDEVQDFTEQQVYLMSQRADPEYKAVTVVGDIAQKLHNGSTIDVAACFAFESLPVVQLTDNLRQLEAPGLACFSACFRALMQEGHSYFAPSGALAERLEECENQLHGPALLCADDEDEMVDCVITALQNTKPLQTAAVLLPDAESASACYAACKARLAEHMIDAELSEKIDLSRRHVRHFTSIANAKGLEFDVVVVPTIESYRLSDAGHVNRLYVGLTRARKKLVLLSRTDRPESAFDEVWRQYEDALSSV